MTKILSILWGLDKGLYGIINDNFFYINNLVQRLAK